MRWYDLSGIRSLENNGEWEEAAGYFSCLGWKAGIVQWAQIQTPVACYSRQTSCFLFGVPSQWRSREEPFIR
jgi:hypothetical protein